MEEIKKFLPGFMLGFTRSIVSHPFEILKIKSQLNNKNKINLLRGIQYSILSSGLERGLQFYLFDKYLKNNSLLVSSLQASFFTSLISVPYNNIIVNKIILKKELNKKNMSKIFGIEFSRSFLASNIFLTSYKIFQDKGFSLTTSALLATTNVWLLTYPIDNYRNHLMSNKKINILKLYNGIQYPILRNIPSTFIGMFMYEKTKELLD